MRNNILKGLGPNIILLGIVSLVNDISSEMIFAILPFFITALGGAGIATGLIGGLSESIAGVLKIFSGYWSDRISKTKPFIFFGYFSSAVAKLFLPLSPSWFVLLILNSIERIGKGLRTAPRDALIAASTLDETRGKAFGFHRTMDTLGAFLGTLFCFFLFWFLKLDFRPIFFIAAFVGFLGLIPIFWIKEKTPEKFPQEKSGFWITLKQLPKNFRFFLLVAVLFSLANFTYMFFILKARETLLKIFPERLSTAVPILLYLWFNLVYAVFSTPSGMLSDRIGRKNVLAIGYFAYGWSCLGFALGSSIPSFVFLFALYGLSFALIEGNQRALAADFVGKEIRGTALGTFHTTISISALLASLFAGVLWNWKLPAPFFYGAILSFLAVIGISLLPLSTSKQ